MKTTLAAAAFYCNPGNIWYANRCIMQTDVSNLTGTSNTAVAKGTGKTWEEWVKFLDDRNAAGYSHREIVEILSGYIDSAWWCQSVANGYEKIKGKRIPGQTANGKFQLGVSKTLPLTASELWELIASESGMNIWLGELRGGSPGEGAYLTREGISGKITVFKPGSHLRLTWQPEDGRGASVLQVRVVKKGGKSTLTFHHEGLASSAEREELKAYWTEKIERLQQLAGC